MPPEEPTPWELMRRLDQVLEQLGRMETRMLTVDVFKAYQEATERRFQSIEKDQQSWTVESRGEHVRLDGRLNSLNVDFRAQLDAHKEKQDTLERAQREARSRVWLGIGLGVLSILGSLAVGIIMQSSMGGGA